MNVRTYYADYEPPLDYAAYLRGVVERTDPALTDGIAVVLLRNSGSVGRRESRWKLSGGVGPRNVQGIYYRAWKEPARIELFVDKILDRWPSWMVHVPILRYEVISIVFFHELAHHLQAQQKPSEPGNEAEATRIGRQMMSTYFAKRHRILAFGLHTLKKLMILLKWPRAPKL